MMKDKIDWEPYCIGILYGITIMGFVFLVILPEINGNNAECPSGYKQVYTNTTQERCEKIEEVVGNCYTIYGNYVFANVSSSEYATLNKSLEVRNNRVIWAKVILGNGTEIPRCEERR